MTFDGLRVTGVQATASGKPVSFAAAEVIISAGTLQSPVMLLRNGIGSGAELRARGMPVIADRPGVGTNLQNHPVVYIVAQLRRGAAQSAALKSHSVALMRYTSGVTDCPPLDIVCVPFNRAKMTFRDTATTDDGETDFSVWL